MKGALTAALLFASLGTCWSSSAFAQNQNAYKVLLVVNGNTLVNGAGSGPGAISIARTLTAGGVVADLSATANLHVGAKASLSGTAAAQARVQADASYNFFLQPPAGANVKGGKLVLHVVLEGTAVGDADIHLVAAVHADFGKGTNSALISDATTQRVEFDLTADIAPFIEDLSKAQGTVHLHLDSSARLGGISNQVSSAEATNATRVTGFRVLDSSGAQVSGFGLNVAGGTAIPEVAGPVVPPAGGKATAVEFYNATFKHFFVSSAPDEIAKLDNGTFAGWTRTGQTFNVNTAAATSLVPVCRFFTVAFPPTSSHFYAPRGLGCEGTLTNAQWQYEGDVFFVSLPDAAGSCAAGTVPVYRLYNNGQGGAPNHRFTTSETTRTQMLALGYVAEGAGVGVGFCAPQ